MSSYNARRAPNVSQYLANLNTIPSAAHDVTADLSIPDADLDFLTNAEFFDFDSFQDLHGPSPQAEKKAGPLRSGMALAPNATSPLNDADKTTAHQFQFAEFQTYPNQPTSLHGQYPPQPNHQLAYPSPQTGEKRKSSLSTPLSSPTDLEEQSRVAAEEDKRRRNTAASARFRVKKKQREQALEKQAKEMAEKVQQLEGKVQQLEMENKWLKGLITDKSDVKSLEAMQADKKIDDRIPVEPRRGVGTEGEDDEDEDAEE